MSTPSQPNLRLIVFDLDGTLLDTRQDIKLATQETRAEFLLDPPSDEDISDWFGKHPRRFFSELSADDLTKAISSFRAKLMHSKGEAKLFSDSLCTLEKLKKKGFTIAVATTKPTLLASSILRKTQLMEFLDYIQGTDDFAEKPNPEVFFRLERGLNQANPSLKAHAYETKITVGDRVSDIRAGVSAGYVSFGIMRPFNHETEDEFLSAGANAMLTSLEQLGNLEFGAKIQ